MYLKCLYLRNCLLYCTVYTCTCKCPCCSGGKSVNNCISARGVRSVDATASFKAFLLHWSSECSLMCNVNVVNIVSCFCLIIFFLEGIGVALATLATPLKPSAVTHVGCDEIFGMDVCDSVTRTAMYVVYVVLLRNWWCAPTLHWSAESLL